MPGRARSRRASLGHIAGDRLGGVGDARMPLSPAGAGSRPPQSCQYGLEGVHEVGEDRDVGGAGFLSQAE
jgi:hypothetical protein